MQMLKYDASGTLSHRHIHTRSPAAMVSQAGILGTLLIVYFTALAVNKGNAIFSCCHLASVRLRSCFTYKLHVQTHVFGTMDCCF
jgi:hypothetical protein